MKKCICSVLLINTLLVLYGLCEDPSAEQKSGTQLRIMTFNTMFGGTKRGQPLSQTAKVIQDGKADVAVTGDFNEPSHLDWTEVAAKSGRHPIKVDYPSSLEMAKAGFSDS